MSGDLFEALCQGVQALMLNFELFIEFEVVSRRGKRIRHHLDEFHGGVAVELRDRRRNPRRPLRDGRSVDATMELGYGQRIVFFNWTGFDEGDQVCGSGSAELEDDGSIEIELSFHNGDDAILKARRE